MTICGNPVFGIVDGVSYYSDGFFGLINARGPQQGNCIIPLFPFWLFASRFVLFYRCIIPDFREGNPANLLIS